VSAKRPGDREKEEAAHATEKEAEEIKKEEAREKEKEEPAEKVAPEEKVVSAERYEALRKELDEKKTEAAEYLDHLKRLKAEFENYKKRQLKEQTQFLELAAQDLMGKLLPVLDNFELAVLAAEESKDFERLVKGIEMVYGEFMDVLHKEGVQLIESIGKAFDPQVHDAVMQVHSDEHEDNTIVDVLRQGYTLKGRVIRPAMVKVAKR
jgi:molecular chaperone GrpE